MNKTFLIIISLVLLFSCNTFNKNPLGKTKTSPSKNVNYVYLEDVKNGQGLNRASITSDRKYFDYIMSNELGNPKGKPIYETILETSDKVYYGVVKVVPGINKQIIDPFYAAPIENIRMYFPGFQDIDGNHVKAKAFYSFFDREIETILKPVCPNSYSYHYNNMKIDLVNNGIRVDAILQGKCYEDVIFGKEVSALLDPNTLDVLQEYSITLDNTKGEKTEDGAIGESEPVLKKGIKGKLKSLY